MAHEKLTRAVPFELDRAADGAPGDGLSLSGYASVFDQTVTVSDMWGYVVLGADQYQERFQRGAFADTIRNGKHVDLMYQHGRSFMGPYPIGTIESLAEDSHGLHVGARLLSNWLVEPVRDAIANQAIRGMSITYEPIDYEVDHSGDVPLVTHRAGRLYELGPVVMPVYDTTEVAVRSLLELNDYRRFRPSPSNTPVMAEDVAALSRMAEDVDQQTTTTPPAVVPQSTLEAAARLAARQAPNRPPRTGR